MITIDPIKRPPKKSCSVDTTEIMKEVGLKFAPKETVSKLLELESKTVEIETQLSNVYTKEEIDNLLSLILNKE